MTEAPKSVPAPKRALSPAALLARSRTKLGWLGPAVVVGGLIPVLVLLQDARSGALGANPVRQAELQTGLLTLTMLVISLACTPLRRVTGWTWPARIRKATGLLAGLYAGLHFLLYLVDQGFSLPVALQDVLKRPYITVGFAALVILTVLALTSTKGSVKRLGFMRWTRLHQLVYVAISLGLLHYWWSVKKDHTSPLIYILVVAVLFAVRLFWKGRKKTPAKVVDAGKLIR